MGAEPGIAVIGVGADGLDGLTPAQWRQLHDADPVAASPRLLPELQERLPGRTLLSTREPGPLLDALAAARQRGERPAVLASGDPLWFGIGRRLAERFGADALRVQPATYSPRAVVGEQRAEGARRLGAGWFVSSAPLAR